MGKINVKSGIVTTLIRGIAILPSGRSLQSSFSGTWYNS